MKNKNTPRLRSGQVKEIVVATLLIIIAFLILNPFYFWMPDLLLKILLVGIFILFGFYAIFIIRERAGDEREDFHRMLAGRNAFLAGSLVIIIGIIVEATTYMIDKWLVLALIVMLVVKLLTRFWSDRNL
jgi:hypothetical protein